MNAIKFTARALIVVVCFLLWSEHCYQRGAAAAEEQCEWESEYVPPDSADA
jgi:hypothetical protein